MGSETGSCTSGDAGLSTQKGGVNAVSGGTVSSLGIILERDATHLLWPQAMDSPAILTSLQNISQDDRQKSPQIFAQYELARIFFPASQQLQSVYLALTTPLPERLETQFKNAIAVMSAEELTNTMGVRSESSLISFVIMSSNVNISLKCSLFHSCFTRLAALNSASFQLSDAQKTHIRSLCFLRGDYELLEIMTMFIGLNTDVFFESEHRYSESNIQGIIAANLRFEQPQLSNDAFDSERNRMIKIFKLRSNIYAHATKMLVVAQTLNRLKDEISAHTPQFYAQQFSVLKNSLGQFQALLPSTEENQISATIARYQQEAVRNHSDYVQKTLLVSETQQLYRTHKNTLQALQAELANFNNTPQTRG